MASSPGEQNRASKRYSELQTLRHPYLERARDNAKLTIPALLPPEGSSGSTELVKPYQSVGSQGTNNLSAKLLLALFPPNQSFFRLMVPPSAMATAEGENPAALQSKIEEGLSKIEKEVLSDVETSTLRVTIGETLKNLIVTGNYLIRVLEDGTLKGHRMDRFVVKRDPAGNVTELIVHEKISASVLPESFLNAIKSKVDAARKTDANQVLDIYTWLRREGGEYLVHQEVGGEVVPKSEGSYPKDACPFIPLRWVKSDGEDYGRSHVDDCYGDLRSLEGLSGAMTEAAAAASKVLFFVNPTGITRAADVTQAPNLGVIPGRAEDVTTLQVQKSSDLAVAFQQASNIERRLASAFLMTRSVQRNAERVTAEEIRLLASELEDALGGVYALLAQELQQPLVNSLMARLQRENRIPVLPDYVKPAVVTGLPALGRNHELNRLMLFAEAVQGLLGPSALQVLNSDEAVRRVATALSIESKDLIKTKDEIAQEQANAQQTALVERLGPNVIQARAAQQQQQSTQQPQEANSAPQ